MSALAEVEITPIDNALTLLELPIGDVVPAPDNPRTDLGDLAELATSVRAVGIVQPLVVTQVGTTRYMIVAGHRRFAAAALAGLKSVPVVVRAMTNAERLEAMLIENLQREDVKPLDEARAYQRLIEEFGMTQRQIADRVGRSQGHISKRLVLLSLPDKVRKDLDSGGITIDDARALTQLVNMPQRLAQALKDGKCFHGGLQQAVNRQLREHELEQKIAKATAELEQQGLKVVAYKKDRYGGYAYELPNGAIELDGWQAHDLKLTPANHKAQPCHAAAVNPRTGEIVYACTKPANHRGKTKLETPADEKEKARKARETEKRAQLKAREKNVELGRLLAKKLKAPKIDARNMRLLADIVMHGIGTGLAQTTLRYTDEASQTVIAKKDGSTSRIVHVEGNAARALVDQRLAEASTPEEIMGVLLQLLLSVKLVDKKAVPASQRHGEVGAIDAYYGSQSAKKALAEIAQTIGKSTGDRTRSKR